MKTSDWIALDALIVAVISVLATLTERASRKREVEQERKDRREQLDLFRRQVEGEAERRLSERRADLVCRQGSRGGASPDLDEYSVSLLNGGRATAHDVRAWIAGSEGQALSDPQRPGALLPDSKPIEFKLSLPHVLSRDPNVRIFLRAAWVDGDGEHEENLTELGKV